MIYGIGADILRVSRIGKVYARHGERFLDHILHPAERAAIASQRKPALYLAKAFAVKEAFVKALGTGFRDVAHEDIASTRGKLGEPALAFSAKLQKKLDRLGIVHSHVSVSDDEDWVCAMVVLEKRDAARPARQLQRRRSGGLPKPKQVK